MTGTGDAKFANTPNSGDKRKARSKSRAEVAKKSKKDGGDGPLSGNYLGSLYGILWEFCEHSLGILWTFFGHSLHILWAFFTHSLGIIYTFFGHSLIIFRHSLDILWAFTDPKKFIHS